MTPEQEINALRTCVRRLWQGMKPAKVYDNTYWTEGGETWEHVGCMTIDPDEITALARTFEGLPRDVWPYSELTSRGIPEDKALDDA